MSEFQKIAKDQEGRLGEPSMGAKQSVAGSADATLARVASSAHGMVDATRTATTSALAGMDEQLDRALPAFQKAGSRIDAAARAGLQSIKDAKDQTYEHARSAKETAVGYVRREPGKGLLISAAIGAVCALALGWSRKTPFAGKSMYRNKRD